MTRSFQFAGRPATLGATGARLFLSLVLVTALLLLAEAPAGAQSGSAPLLAGGGGPMVELFLLDPDELEGVTGLPGMVLLQGGGGFGRYQAWRVGGAGAAGQTQPTDDGSIFSLTYGGVQAAYLPGAYGALPLPSPRSSIGALFGMGLASIHQTGDSHSLPFILFRPEASLEFALGNIGTLQVGASYTFPIPLGSDSGPLGDLRAIQKPGFRLGLVFGGF